MNIFPIEIADGLREVITSSNSLAFISILEKEKDGERGVCLNELKTLCSKQQKALSAHLGERSERDTYDLFHVKTLLVSTGWNGNDDIFDKNEVWAARHSPEDKPFNLEHSSRHIIGHITNNIGVDVNRNVIVDDIDIDHLPDELHIVTSAVIYRHLDRRDKELTEEAAEIIAGIKNGDWFVSMECLFDDFDYGLRNPSTGQIEKVIARQESTAFLTKHLRAYEGTGQYGGYSIGRVLRNITFIGKGLVETPANPNSKFIFNDMEAFAGKLVDCEDIWSSRIVNSISDVVVSNDVFASQSLLTNSKRVILNYSITKEESRMTDESKVKELENKLVEANHKLTELDTKSIQAKIDAKDAEIVQRDETIASLNTRVEELKANAKESEKDLAEADKTLVEKTKEAEAVVAELSTIKAEATKVNRISTLVDKGFEKAKAEDIVVKFLDLDDEKFASIAELIEIPSDKTNFQSGVSKASGESNDSTKTTSDEAEASDEKSLDDAKEVIEPSMAAASEDVKATKKESAMALASFIGSMLKVSRKS